MSYDFGTEIDAGGPEPLTLTWKNYTYNVGPMFRMALGGNGLHDLAGVPCRDAEPRLKAATDMMRGEPDDFRRLNPVNGWGNYEGAMECLSWLAEQCAAAPAAQVYVR